MADGVPSEATQPQVPTLGPSYPALAILTAHFGDWFHDEFLQIIEEDPEKYTFDLDLSAVKAVNDTIFDNLVEHPENYRRDLSLFLSEYTAHVEWMRWYAATDEEMQANFSGLIIDEPMIVPEVEASVEFVNAPDSITIDIGNDNLDHLGELVAVEGVGSTLSGTQPRRNEVVFRCDLCNTLQDPVNASWTTDLKKVQKVAGACEACERKNCFTPASNMGEMVPYQQMKLQEPPQDSIDNPRKIAVDVYDRDMHDLITPGERGTIIGVLKENTDTDTTLVEPFVEAISMQANESGHLDMEFSKREASQFKEVSQHPELVDAGINTFAPETDIAGYRDVKESLLLMAFGGPSRYDAQGNLLTRGFSHILLIGDAGTAKSALTRKLKSLVPHGVGVDSGTSTAVGLTATAEKEEIGGTEEWVVRAGALPMADEGVLAIDELDKFNNKEIKSLAGAMANGHIEVKKASIKADLRTHTSVVATANPIDGDFNSFESYNEQFDLPTEILNRFDLVWVFRDVADEELDSRISDAVRSAHTDWAAKEVVADGEGDPDTLFLDDGSIRYDFFTRYIAYARETCDPELVEGSAAYEAVDDTWMRIRNTGDADRNAINPRKYHGLIRLAEASARMHLREEVTVDDVKRAERLMLSSLKEAASDEEGRIDISRLETGTSSVKRWAIKNVLGHVRDLQSEYDDEPGAPLKEVVSRAERDYEEQTIQSAINTITTDGRLVETEEGYVIAPN
ncbi:replicative DNA helicase Mcm [Halopelagius inordinatus]|uniref:Replicative DNA helicase Mcm n=1 Tax=Halopelagius inordinatus TaxID=553467 RepID=A0A1I2NBI7_9EURY|nr:minichromosome maintenance protein MCM [Halopelagius inordinatus]SFG00953.1 replicative DNA helicase Mcm [Halopelagius inordinatus]